MLYYIKKNDTLEYLTYMNLTIPEYVTKEQVINMMSGTDVSAQIEKCKSDLTALITSRLNEHNTTSTSHPSINTKLDADMVELSSTLRTYIDENIEEAKTTLADNISNTIHNELSTLIQSQVAESLNSIVDTGTLNEKIGIVAEQVVRDVLSTLPDVIATTITDKLNDPTSTIYTIIVDKITDLVGTNLTTLIHNEIITTDSELNTYINNRIDTILNERFPPETPPTDPTPTEPETPSTTDTEETTSP